MQTALILGLAALIGLALGAAGGGGSILAVPVLVGVAGLAVTEATTASLIVVGTAAAIGLASDLRTGRVRLALGVVFGLTGIGGAAVGTTLNRGLDEGVLLIGFAALMVVVAGRMALNLRKQAAGPSSSVPSDPPTTGGEPVPAAGERAALSLQRVGESAAQVTTRRGRVRNCRIVAGINTCQLVRIVAAGTAVGLLTGLFGVGGGFIIVPALVLVLDFDIRSATATSLVVIAINSAVALALRADLGSVDWGIVAPFTALATAGVLLGRRVAHRLPARTLSVALTVLVLAMAAWTAVQGVTALA